VLRIVPKPVNNGENTGYGRVYPSFMTDDALAWPVGYSDKSNPRRAPSGAFGQPIFIKIVRNSEDEARRPSGYPNSLNTIKRGSPEGEWTVRTPKKGDGTGDWLIKNQRKIKPASPRPPRPAC
jgi:hypothetical protein